MEWLVRLTVVDSWPLIEHWNVASWQIAADPPASNRILSAVAALSADDIWAVGGSFDDLTPGSRCTGMAALDAGPEPEPAELHPIALNGGWDLNAVAGSAPGTSVVGADYHRLEATRCSPK
jgi:hypothetical protein